MVSWYAAFFFAMIKDLEDFSYVTLLIPYLVLLGAAVGISQFMKKKMEKEVKEEQ
jgi:Sec-independent protein secretion pathway component TatC